MLSKIFGKKDSKAQTTHTTKSFTMPAGFIRGTGSSEKLSAKAALRFYLEASPVSTAVDWINDEFKSLDLVLKQGGDVTSVSPILDKLKRPNDDMTQRDFLETLGAYWLLTNEVYIIATGNVAKAPLELLIVSPEYVSTKRGSDGFTATIEVRTASGGMEQFNRDIKAFRFYNSQRNREIWRIKGFAPFVDDTAISTQTNGDSMGRSKLSSVKLEIEQYIEVAKHNLAKLNNGMRPSGAITTPLDVVIPPDEYERLQEQIVTFYSSSENSGKVLVLPGGFEFVPFGNHADMDFNVLTEQVSRAVFTRYKVPLQLVTTDQAAAATAESAMLSLYDNAVLPMSWRLLEELTIFLGERYKLDPNDVILPNLNTIPALQIRRNAELKLKVGFGVLTTNEIRNEVGFEGEIKGGDLLYIPSNLVPIGTQPVVNNPAIPVNTVKDSHTNLTRKSFIELMQEQVDSNGEKVYSAVQLEQIADDEGLE